MKTANISDVTDSEFSSAVQLIISGIKASDPRLDTRLGTVLRSLLVDPEARIEAVTSKQIDYVRKATSLKNLNEAKLNGDDIDAADVNAILSNFNLKSSSGTKSTGLVKISIEDGSKTYVIAEGTEFETIDGLIYTADATTQYPSASHPIYEGSSNYFFIVNVTATDVGAHYNIAQGTDLSVSDSIFSFVSAEAYKSFDGGSDIDDIEDTIEKIPSGLAIRGFLNKSSCEGLLRDEFDSGSYPIVACSTVGYGNGAQRRDKHNVLGVGVGGRIDLYVRNFGDLYTITKTVKGKRLPYNRDSAGNIVSVSYELDLTVQDFPGSCWVKSVSSIYDVNSSLEFTCSRIAYGVDKTWHDFDVNNTAEIFNSVWQGFKVTVNEVPPDIGNSTSTEEDDDWSFEREFVVSVYCMPEAEKLQNYVDRDDIRSMNSDIVVRCPVICKVAINATLTYDVDKPVDVNNIKYKIREYINNKGFVGILTRSEIVHIIKNCGAISVDLSKNDMLYGVLHDAYGKEYDITGDALQIDGLATVDAMVTVDTTVFAIEDENIQLTLVPNK